MSNDKPKMSLRILHLEDDPGDRELIAAALDDAGWDCEFIYAASETEFNAALRQPNLDVILSNFSTPSYHGLATLESARQTRPDVPFIYVSGTIGEVRAVESLRAGATDYVLKERVERLIPVVQRALREAELRRSQKQAEEQLRNSEQRLRRSEERFRQMAENIPCVFWMADAA